MKVILFGSTGMIGQGALRECLLDPAVDEVLAIVRKPAAQTHAKLRELVHSDFTDYTRVAPQLAGYDAAFFCLGTSSVGKSEAEYRVITYDFTLAAARALLAQNPRLSFIYISGEGADQTEKGRVMWARVRGKTENDLLALSSNVYVIRPAVIQPMHGVEARQRWTRLLYKATAPLLPALRKVLPNYVTTTEELGRVMLDIAKRGSQKRVLTTSDLRTRTP
jgi:uncharacterized protein YbjT (DUF2867 family)